MPKQPRMRAPEAETLLLREGFQHIRTKGSHRIYMKDNTRVVVPYHSGRDLHPKIVRQILSAIEEESV
jgi:predicted RNA binding protein YcfA (HicA-like mRNA interferase family)